MQASTTHAWSLGKLLEDWSSVQEHYSEIAISGLSLDGRSACQGDLFFALQGLQQHGVEYSQQAVSNGASALAWETSSQVNKNDLPKSIPCFEINNLQEKLGFICQRFYNNPSAQMNVVAVTGTDGKTSVSQFIAQALHQLGFPCGVIGTLGYGLYPNLGSASHTTPDAVRMHGLLHEYVDQVNHVVLEASSHGLSQARLNGVEVDTAVFTNLGRDHMDYHQSIDDYFHAKRILFQGSYLKNAVINIDDEYGVRLAEEFSKQLNVISYSVKSNSIDVKPYVNASNISYVAGVTSFVVDSSWGKAPVETNLFGEFNVSNLLAVIGVLLASGVEFSQAVKIISDVKTVPGRMEFISGVRGLGGQDDAPAIVIDYAHTPQALNNVLRVLKEHCSGKLWCVFGCGGNRDQGKRKLMAQAVEQYADMAVITDDNPRFENPEEITNEITTGFSSSSSYSLIHDRQKAIEYAIQNSSAEDIVLIAGKGHEAVQIINHDHLPFDDKKIASEVLHQAP
ncbi:MAG: UDP-N-acetylmuramoyl-L-alanyl-D-glutamate--2,6-diaminopimelate ligase [Gammaproteobacteria bacterium]